MIAIVCWRAMLDKHKRIFNFFDLYNVPILYWKYQIKISNMTLGKCTETSKKRHLTG
jgi:hypothetical protein